MVLVRYGRTKQRHDAVALDRNHSVISIDIAGSHHDPSHGAGDKYYTNGSRVDVAA
jgi:hypothetical protein